MPVVKCRNRGTSGYKFGNAGKCFTGRNAKARATTQGVAIKARGGK